MERKAESAERATRPGKWERIDDYLRPIRRRGSAWRRGLSARLDHDEQPDRALLSTLPFVALLGGLALVSVIIFGLAWPGNYQEQARPKGEPAAKLGTAPPGWIEGDGSG